MRIAIDARLFGAMKHRGLGRYISNLIDNLASQDKVNDYFLLIDPDNPEQPQGLPDNFKLVSAPFRVYSFKEQIRLPRLIKNLKVDFTHYPHFNAPLLAPRPYLVTVHDLIVHRFPDRQTSSLPWLFYFIKLISYHVVVGQALRRATKIITVSQTTAQDIVNYYPKTEKKIKVIYLAPVDQSPADLKIDYDYILAVGAAYPHKNLDRLVKAYQLSSLKEKGIKLVLAGRMDYFMERLKKTAQDNDLANGLVFWGATSHEALATLYKNCLAYVLPSLWEGFGLGPLEALSFKKPVLVSDLPVLKEILGQAVWYFNPQDLQDMTNKLQQVVNLKTKDFSLAKLPRTYNWYKTAQETLEVYQSVKIIK